MVIKHALLLAAALAALPLAFQPDFTLTKAQAQLMGNESWNYTRGSRGFWASYQAVRKSQDGAGGGSGGGGTGIEVTQYTTITNSTAIANQNVVTQTLGSGATGVIGNHVGQDAVGDQSARTRAETNVITDNSQNVLVPGLQ